MLVEGKITYVINLNPINIALKTYIVVLNYDKTR